MTKSHLFLIFSLAVLSSGSGLATAQDSASVSIDVHASVPMSCEVSNHSNFSQIGPNSFIIGTISRFCNTSHDIYIGNGAEHSSGQISIGSSTVSLTAGLKLVVANSAPMSGTEQIILSGVDRVTALKISASLSTQITPSGI